MLIETNKLPKFKSDGNGNDTENDHHKKNNKNQETSFPKENKRQAKKQRVK